MPRSFRYVLRVGQVSGEEAASGDGESPPSGMGAEAPLLFGQCSGLRGRARGALRGLTGARAGALRALRGARAGALRGSGGKRIARGSAESSGILPGPPEGMWRGALGSSLRGGAFAAGAVGKASGCSRGRVCVGKLGSRDRLRARGERGPGDKLISGDGGTSSCLKQRISVTFSPKRHPRSGR